jgi:hypothetical protein
MSACVFCTHVFEGTETKRFKRERELSWQLGVREYQLKYKPQEKNSSLFKSSKNILQIVSGLFTTSIKGQVII